MSTPRFVAHLDLDAFFCAVEVLKDPGLKDKPIVVGGRPEQRGVVAAASYPARKYGIHSAMPMAEAVRRCPELIIISHGFKSYKAYSRLIMGIIRSETRIMQQVSIDEAYFELTDHIAEWDDGITIARRIKHKISRDVGLTASIGISTNKMIAKIASDYEKPDGFTVVHPGSELSFLAPLPVQKISGIGKQTTKRLHEMGIRTILELRNTPEKILMDQFGKHGVLMSRWSHAIDNRSLTEERETKSISQERTFSKDIHHEGVLLEKLDSMSESVAKQLVKEGVSAKTVIIKIRYADFHTITRQQSFKQGIQSKEDILKIAAKLFRQYWDHTKPLRLLGVGVSGLVEKEVQMTLEL